MTLTDFLLARIAEDEAVAAEPVVFDSDGWARLADRVLAECDAKRRIVEAYLEHDHRAGADHKWSGFAGGYATATDHIVGLLALPYADHPDYREEWRP